MSTSTEPPESSTGQRWNGESAPGLHDPAQAAFQEGLEIFKKCLTNDVEKRSHADQLYTCKLEDLLSSVIAAQTHYHGKKGSNKIRKCIVAFSRRVCYYGDIMDILVQHHPEYVSLAWGAIKFLFGAIIEHERTGMTILTALCDIADSLPRIELTVSLYPTDEIKQAVATLYAHIIRFLIRALGYYEESSFARAIHSITRPALLRYDDLIKKIQQDSKNIARHAVGSSQAELREMHIKINLIQKRIDGLSTQVYADGVDLRKEICVLTEMVSQMRLSTFASQRGLANVQDTLQSTLSDIQLRQALAMASLTCPIKHDLTFQAAATLYRRRLGEGTNRNSNTIWKTPQLREWDKSRASSAIVLRTTFRQRQQLMQFSVGLIQQLRESKIATMWILVDVGQVFTLLDVLKSLALQALSLNPGGAAQSESQFAFQMRKFLDARLEDDYFNLLPSILQHFKLVYIIFSAKSISNSAALECRRYLYKLKELLSERGARTILKVITVDYGPELSPEDSLEDFVANAKKKSAGRHKRQIRRAALTAY